MQTVKPISPLEDRRLQRAQHTPWKQVGPFAAFCIFLPWQRLEALCPSSSQTEATSAAEAEPCCKELERRCAVPIVLTPPYWGDLHTAMLPSLPNHDYSQVRKSDFAH